jgi:hypothetical protein
MVTHPPRTAPPELYRTFAISAPLSSHWRDATCAEVECTSSAQGFTVTCDLRTELGLRQARYIRDHSGRSWTHEVLGSGVMIRFSFPAGQRCFAQHRVPLEREPIFVVRNGDHRGVGRGPAGKRVFDRPEHWVETFAEHQQGLAETQARG